MCVESVDRVRYIQREREVWGVRDRQTILKMGFEKER